MSTILRITDGNFRLLQRLFAQSARSMEFNHLTRLTDDLIEAARESLVIGVTCSEPPSAPELRPKHL